MKIAKVLYDGGRYIPGKEKEDTWYLENRLLNDLQQDLDWNGPILLLEDGRVVYFAILSLYLTEFDDQELEECYPELVSQVEEYREKKRAEHKPHPKQTSLLDNVGGNNGD